MAFVNVEANTGGKDIPFEVGTLKVALLTQTDKIAANSQLSPKGFSRIIGMICTQGILVDVTTGYYAAGFDEANQDEVSVTGGTDSANYLIFGF